MVCRDDNWGQGATPYQALKDPGDGIAGVRVAASITIPWANFSFLGQERIGSHLSIAVDPNDQNSVFVAWADYPNGVAPYTIHLRHSTDGGVTWSADLRTVANGINPALAVNILGHVGFLYQTLTNAGADWETHVEISTDSFTTAPTDILLAIVPSTTPAVYVPSILGRLCVPGCCRLNLLRRVFCEQYAGCVALSKRRHLSTQRRLHQEPVTECRQCYSRQRLHRPVFFLGCGINGRRDILEGH